MLRTTAQGYATRTRILDAIRTLTISQQRPPTYREIIQQAGISMGCLTYNLGRLEAAGIIRQLGGQRGVVLVAPDERS